ncbi:hypothetical protein DL769_003083 [Monosporascus sp. CRB-8-3]|nr:hypothetical protein DL769_003083 [Monosporascus sp. CRB-8-3]
MASVAMGLTIAGMDAKAPVNSGFCGYTEEFGGDDKVKRPSCSVSDKPVKRVIGYYESWSMSERSCYNMAPEKIPFGQYTHIIFSFATINPGTFKVSPGDSQTESLMSRIGSIKLVQPDIKIWLAIGGWAFNDPGPTQTTFSDTAASSDHTSTFLDSLAQMMNKYGFDGIDIDWEYPVAKDRNGRPEDYENAVTFMKKLRARMKSMNKGVSMAIPASYWYLQNFDIKALESTVDWFNLMSYDVHGSWDIDNEWTGPWVNSHTNMTEIQQALDLLWRNDISASKVTMGMAFYSRSFTLTDPSCSDPGCRVSSAGNPGWCSDTAGVLLHPEIKEIVDKNKLSPKLHREAAVKTVSWGNQWVSFDDTATWRLKANLARSQCIDGFMVWAISHDDADASNARALNSALGRKTPDFPDFEEHIDPTPQPVQGPKLCRWTSCFEGCPPGFKEVQRDGHKEIMMDAAACLNGEWGHGFTRLCCPSNYPLPTCTWRGHRNSGRCKPGCNVGEVEVGTLRHGCSKNYQSACCEDTDVTASWGKCIWTDCLDEGQDACGAAWPHLVTRSGFGSGGMKQCGKGQRRAYCCFEPPPPEFAGECRWVDKVGHLKGGGNDNLCEGACHDGQIRVALQLGFNLNDKGRETACYGYSAFCCDEPKALDPRGGGDDDKDSFGSSQAKEFKLLLDKYMENPTCPATVLEPPIHGIYRGTSSATKRDLIVEARDFEILRGRATDCTLDNWTRLLSFATLMFTMKQSAYDPMRRIWDNTLADSLDEDLRFAGLEDFLYDYPMFDPRGLLEYVLWNPTEAGPGLRRARGTNDVFCELPSSSSSQRKRQEGGIDVHKRYIWMTGGGTNDVPGMEVIFQGIARGDLSLHYARWQYQRERESRSAPGPFLELAYWIGPSPGIASNDPNLNQYRDRTPRQVFHLHIDPTMDWLQSINGHTYMGVTNMQVYHGQETRPAAGGYAWRIDNQDHTVLTERSGWHCLQEEGSLWYVGAPRNVAGLEEWYTLHQA